MSEELKELLFTFEGRINRAKWWGFFVAAWLVNFVLYGVVYLLSTGDSPTLFVLSVIVATLVAVALWLSGIFVTIKRWHDRGKPGWWIFIVLVPIIGGIWALVELGFLTGDPVDNRWGPNPLDPAAARR
ncbi:MAG: DUF805 domain-containing protein [Acidimicrobiia bacterium]|nr:DUF805 domain-containing protein [Acidimicrobiia bacterium]